MGLSRNKIKLIRKLEKKKYRNETGLFVVQGRKIVQELLKSDFRIKEIIGTEQELSKVRLPSDIEISLTDSQEFSKISIQQNPQEILAIVEIHQWDISPMQAQDDYILCLDNIQDPGNMGTIIRLCDWFNISGIVCSPDTVDIYNPKVVQSSMGSVFRVPVMYSPLIDFLRAVNSPIYGTFLEGENLNEVEFSQGGVIIMGNEAHGISSKVASVVDKKITIPRFRHDGAESLNVAMATSIVLWEVRRR